MNKMNPLETQLRYWLPRRPSARLERRLFGREAAAPRAINRLGWLVPATACLLFACVILHQPSGVKLSALPQRGTIVAAILSNQSYVTSLPVGSEVRQEGRRTFEWTNGSMFTSSNQSGSLAYTND